MLPKDNDEIEKLIMKSLVDLYQANDPVNLDNIIPDDWLYPNFYILLNHNENECTIHMRKIFYHRTMSIKEINDYITRLNKNLMIVVNLLDRLKSTEYLDFGTRNDKANTLGPRFDDEFKSRDVYAISPVELEKKLIFYSDKVLIPQKKLIEFIGSGFKTQEQIRYDEQKELQRESILSSEKKHDEQIFWVIVSIVVMILLSFSDDLKKCCKSNLEFISGKIDSSGNTYLSNPSDSLSESTHDTSKTDSLPNIEKIDSLR